jgi:adenylate kinase
MNLVFLGPPGSGKGTQSATVTAELGIPQISTGDTIRAAIRGDTELGREAKSYAESGKLVPDGLINRMVRSRLAEPDCSNGFLLDGFPRTVAQAEALDEMLASLGRKLDHVLLLDVGNDVLLERVTGRRSDPETGRVYHIRFDPPPSEIADRLIQRKDDTAEVFERRLVEYRDKTAPLIPFYEGKGLLRRIDGVGSRDEIGERILAALGH